MGPFDTLKKLFGAGTSTPSEQPSTGTAASAAQMSHQRLDRYWASIGAVEPDLLAHLISPSFTGGPSWPTTRQAYRVIRRGSSIILATDGMSDPFDGVAGMGNGFEMELFLETADIPASFAGDKGDVGRIKESWAFELLHHVGEMVAEAGGITARLERYDSLSVELPGFSQSHALAAQLPARFATADDSLGILLGAPDPDFPAIIDDMPLSAVRMVSITLLTAAELEHLRQGGAAARHELVQKLAAAPSRHRCDLQRPSLV
ncbi:suppressor of fused domain protein [Dyella silvatica]|uniref:suppressor of fused domain protein n=1 Tax=Dyella silvatica TaxID=2992128 RepID=UPI002251EC14|nr:suppressor of fused domain protein [Dyella silvatica]